MKKNVALGLTMSVLLLGMIAIATPVFAIHVMDKERHKFDPDTLPQKGTQYALTISGLSKSMKHERGPFKAIPGELFFKPKQVPIEGKVLINVDERKSANPTVVRLVIESGHIKIGDKAYAIDSGVAIYNNRFTLSVSGTDLTLDVKGVLSGGIPDKQTVSTLTNYKSSLRADGENWILNGGMSMSRLN